MPFHWQYRLAEDAEWKGFSEQDNEKLEKMYRDPTLEECSAAGFEIHVDRQVVCKEVYKQSIAVKPTTMLTFQSPFRGELTRGGK